MENYNNEIFGFGSDTNENMEQTTNFNYDTISGLGQSDYENEDLFNTEVESNNFPVLDNFYNEQSNNSLEDISDVGVNYIENDDLTNIDVNELFDSNPFIQNFDTIQNNEEEGNTDNQILEVNNQLDNFEDFVNETPNYNIIDIEEQPKIKFDPMTGEPINSIYDATNVEQGLEVFDAPEIVEPKFEEEYEQPEINIAQEEVETAFEDDFELVPPIGPGLPNYKEVEAQQISEEQPEINIVQEEVETASEDDFELVPPIGPGLPNYKEVEAQQISEEQPLETPVEEEIDQVIPEEKIEISDTPIEELNKLTEYEEEKIEKTDINSLFDKVSVNVKDASDIFRRNTDLKKKIDTRFEELKKLQSELESSRNKQLDEINKYKSEVLEKLTEKKEEIERRLNILKESQVTLEKEKKEFEEYKKKEQDNIDRVQKEVQSAYDDRREELNHIEDVLRKQKDSLDEERSQLSLDRIQYESDKNELANNLLKFNELVNSFTNGVNNVQE